MKNCTLPLGATNLARIFILNNVLVNRHSVFKEEKRIEGKFLHQNRPKKA